MTNFAEITEALAAKWSDVQALTDNVPAGNIIAYQDIFPVASSVSHAIRVMARLGILVCYMGQEPQGGYERLGHRLKAIIRMGTAGTTDDSKDQGYAPIITAMLSGVGKNDPESLPMQYATIHPDCDPMTAPSWQRLTDADGIDYFEFNTILVERTT